MEASKRIQSMSMSADGPLDSQLSKNQEMGVQDFGEHLLPRDIMNAMKAIGNLGNRSGYNALPKVSQLSSTSNR